MKEQTQEKHNIQAINQSGIIIVIINGCTASRAICNAVVKAAFSFTSMSCRKHSAKTTKREEKQFNVLPF